MLLRLLLPIAIAGGVARPAPSTGHERIQARTEAVRVGAGRLLADAARIASDTGRLLGDVGRGAADVGRVANDTGRVAADTVREYQGLYESGFEVSWFHPCGAAPGDDLWWVTLTNDALRQRDSLARALTGKPRAVFVRWRGTVSRKMPGGAGHMGRGSRYMLVSEVLSLRASDEGGCTST